VTPPWGIVLCHEESYIVTDECGAPEFFGGGLKLPGLPGEAGKIAPQKLQAALAHYAGHGPHQKYSSARASNLARHRNNRTLREPMQKIPIAPKRRPNWLISYGCLR